MTTSYAKELVSKWISNLPKPDMPLFDVDTDNVTLQLDNGLMVGSNAFREHRKAIQAQTRDSLRHGPPHHGVVYLIYRRDPEANVVPLYIGMSAALNSNGKLNALFTDGHIRFNHIPRSNGHLGNLNLVWANPTTTGKINYRGWVREFFDPTYPSPVLKTPIFINMELWTTNSVSILPSMGNCGVATEEAIRIELVRQALLGGSLLNA